MTQCDRRLANNAYINVTVVFKGLQRPIILRKVIYYIEFVIFKREVGSARNKPCSYISTTNKTCNPTRLSIINQNTNLI